MPVGIYRVSLREAVDRFGVGNTQRKLVGQRLEKIYEIARGTGKLSRFIVFGSFITTKAQPNDVDIVILMADDFEAGVLTGEARLLFNHGAAQAHFGASVFWLRRFAVFGDEQSFIADWQLKRGHGRRGILEIVEDVS